MSSRSGGAADMAEGARRDSVEERLRMMERSGEEPGMREMAGWIWRDKDGESG